MKKRIDELVNEAQSFYPYTNTARALALFQEAISLASSAPPTLPEQKNVDNDSVGFAVWGGWVCLGLLDASPEDINQFLRVAERVSPVTARRIQDRLAEYSESVRQNDEIAEIMQELKNSALISTRRVEELTLALSEIAKKESKWWLLRDAAITLTPTSHKDVAWSLFNQALFIAAPKGGNIPSIYMSMGDLCKLESRYDVAAMQYLLSIQASHGQPLKKALSQLNICLKKAGVAESKTVCDWLITIAQNSDVTSVLNAFDQVIKESAIK